MAANPWHPGVSDCSTTSERRNEIGTMFNAVIAFALKNRFLVVVLTLLTAGVGGYCLSRAPVDVFPELNRPTVTIMTEFPGRAPEEVEALVTFPIEAAMNGAAGVQRVRSQSGVGLSVVDVEFNWGNDPNVVQQIVSQRLQVVLLPPGIRPVLMPMSSIMGEIMLVGLDSVDGHTSPMELRTLADWVIRPRLMTIPGISQVRVMGGVIKQYQVLTDPARLALYDVTLEDLTRAVEKANAVTGGGFLLNKDNESLIRITGRTITLDDLGETIVAVKNGVPVRVKQVAELAFGGPVPRGTGAVRYKVGAAEPPHPALSPKRGESRAGGFRVAGGPAIILDMDKQPGVNTLALTGKIHEGLAQLEKEIQQTHPEVRLRTDVFQQADFIRTAVDNVIEAVREGVLLLAVILFLFLWNFRTGLITLLVLPLPICALGLLFTYFGVSLNTMTLGGIAIAIGDLVDDSIVDIENIYRRLKQWRAGKLDAWKDGTVEEEGWKGGRVEQGALRVVFSASSEVRNSIVYATLIVCLVVFPLFFLSGLEGRMFTPMGVAYVVTLLASLLVSLTITPVLASYLLPRAKFLQREGDPVLVRLLKGLARPVVRLTLRHPGKVLALAAVLVVASLATLPFMGGEFLPPFNEGTLTINVLASPGTSLQESTRLAAQAEKLILEAPEVRSTATRTGRAELDEHAEGVNSSDIEVSLREHWRPRSGVFFSVLRRVPLVSGLGYEALGRPRPEVIEEIRERLSALPGVEIDVGQPISHRLDHVMSGLRAQVAIKVFGEDLHTLRALAADVEAAIQSVPGVVDLRVEPLEEIDQVRINVSPGEASRYGRAPADVAGLLETALRGRTVGQVLDRQRTFDVVVWYDEAARNDLESIRATLIDTPRGRVPLGQMAEVEAAGGPLVINREHVQRRIAVTCNVQGRDLAGVVRDARAAVAEKVDFPPGYFVDYGGQFEAQQQATFRLTLLVPIVILCIFFLLWKAVESWRGAAQILVNVPLAFFGAVVALLLVNPPEWETLRQSAWWRWPIVWAEASSLSLAHWVGFITLTGIVTRNGIMMISHYIHLMRYEGEKFDEHMILRGTLERLTPVLMTAVTSIVGLLPLVFGAGETGKEILHPLAVVVVGGMISSTLLDQLVTPALFFKFGRKVYERAADPAPSLAASGAPPVRPDGTPKRVGQGADAKAAAEQPPGGAP